MPRGRAAMVFLLCATVVRAQCPDGTPPPCKSATAAFARRANPAVNPRGWIVVPFGNAMRLQELDWLRDGSANLLSLDMGHWTDVDVVPDKRVGDLIRELPAARPGEALTLSDGLAIAKRAGAAKLVMGDFFRVGNGARIVANVFDVASGARVRTVTQQTIDADSLLGSFAPLARDVLAIPPPADAKIGDVGTHRLEAYRAYLLGTRAWNRFDLREARQELTRALALDSTFALAHLAYSMMLEWNDFSGSQSGLAKSHALAAQRLGTSLPRRERLLIDAGVANASGDYGRLCTIARSLIAQDSTDIQGAFFLGECSYHDNVVIPSATDSTSGTFRGSWNTAIRAFKRVIELDPTYLGAFEHVIEMLQRGFRSAGPCAADRAVGASCIQWTSYLLRDGDSLQTVPVRPGSPADAAQARRARVERPIAANHVAAASIARLWLDADTTSDGARVGLARVSLMLGDLATADEQLKHVPSIATVENVSALRLKLEVAAKRGRGTEARALFDSLVKTIPDDPSSDVGRGGLELVFGRVGRFERGAVAASARFGPEAVAYERHVAAALLGVPRPEMASAEAAFFSSMRDTAGCDGTCRLSRVAATLVYSLHMPLGPWPVLADRRNGDRNFDGARALAAHDVAQLQPFAEDMDAEAHTRIRAGFADAGFSLQAATAYLMLGDSASALRMARFFADTSMASLSFSSGFVTSLVAVGPAAFVPRMMLLRADLAAAAGQREEARLWYGRVLDLWVNADPAIQPTVARIRASLSALGPPT